MKTTSMIVGISGFAGSGKDTAAEVLVREYGFTRIAFADVLREMALAIDPYVVLNSSGFFKDMHESQMIYGVDRLSSVIKDYGWDVAKNTYPDVRRLLQRLGTEAGRNILGENIWVDTAFSNVDADYVVVTDVRFPNELAGIHERDGISIRIDRPGIGPRNDHPSETALVDADFRYHVNNDGTVQELHDKVAKLIDAELE